MTKKTRCARALLLPVLLLSLPGLADPPFRDVQFDVPLDLTDLPNIISKVAVECEVTIRDVTPSTDGIRLIRTGRSEVNVVAGAVSQSIRVLVTVPSITKLKPNVQGGIRRPTYACKLEAFLDEGLGWTAFGPSHQQSPGTSRNIGSVTPLTPVPVPLTGDFQW